VPTVDSTTILSAREIRKSFGGNHVLKGVDFDLNAGEIHSLCGQNGAGKSTLMKILNGVYTKDEGTITVGKTVRAFKSARDARDAGIAMVYQDFSLVPSLRVYENAFLGDKSNRRGLFIDDKRAIRETERLLKDIGIDEDIDPHTRVEDLSVGQQQLVELTKALSAESKILILDEPTASLSQSEIKAFFAVLRRLRDRGMAIVYITHYLHDVFEICDRVTVLRDGRMVLSRPTSDVTLDAVIAAMVGDELDRTEKWARAEIDPTTTALLSGRNITTDRIEDISFDLWRGEVLGVAGLLGSGRTELLQALYGIDKLKAGKLTMDGAPLRPRSPAEAIRSGMFLVPEERRRLGLIVDFSVFMNLIIPILHRLRSFLFLRFGEGRKEAQEYVDRFNVQTQGLQQPVRLLSGGNQQKVVVAKSVMTGAKVLLLDDPTFGIDIKSKMEVMRIVRDFVSNGNAAIFVSSELSEIASFCDRTLIMHKGRLVDTIRNSDETTEQSLLHAVQ
jgi:ribose transport system ATP-binding protein